MFDLVSSGGTPFIKIIAASGGVYKGQIVKISSNECTPIAGGHTGETILGLCLEDTVAGALAPIADIRGQVLKVPLKAGTTKTTIVAADYGKLYDVSVDTNEMTLDLDDTTGAIFYPVKEAPAGFAYVMVASSLILF